MMSHKWDSKVRGLSSFSFRSGAIGNHPLVAMCVDNYAPIKAELGFGSASARTCSLVHSVTFLQLALVEVVSMSSGRPQASTLGNFSPC